MKINEVADIISEWRLSHGFYTPNGIDKMPVPVVLSMGDAMLGKLMLVSTEIAEAAEAVRDGDMENFAEELADACIRIFDICATCGIDLEEVIAEKMAINRLRPIKHGRQTTL